MSGFYSPLPDPAEDWLTTDKWLTGTRDEDDEDPDDLPSSTSAALPLAAPREATHLAATADLSSRAVAATVPTPSTKEQT